MNKNYYVGIRLRLKIYKKVGISLKIDLLKKIYLKKSKF